MPQPDTTTFVQLAEQAGATSAEIDHLTPEVKSLTKGQLVQLWGANDSRSAISAYQHGGHAAIPHGAEALHLTLSDITSIQAIFSPQRVTPVIGGGVAQAQVAVAEGDINCCCCPCCCAATSIQPVKRL